MGALSHQRCEETIDATTVKAAEKHPLNFASDGTESFPAALVVAVPKKRLAPAPAESHGLAGPELKLCANACLVLRPPERQPGRARDCLVRGCKSEERSTIRCLNTFRNNIAPYVDLLELRYTGKTGLGIFSRPGCFIPKYTFISE
ncbi:uncharacterized protein CTHT_0018820 [Thermochaetoides thermophila DSM 1495]|uniref:Uncharacterized protein n=1 Tax=Chaetomium thermophilum (strain DSM 1495 / CBS 144.50 / IMI 039719) TaxID=759272 RepID=G0S2X3_CHATD|nr:hypothetical protein CTHT_0018820 [Thermochaetoides thermophila DSM 1495]EGS22356.1 hypothetical protein CTHT_0018820 [Thermochaetoides thermophila DSM 1495]